MESTGQRILVIRPDHLGDVLLTLPALATLRRALPRAHLSFLVPAGLETIPRRCPDVDRTYAVPFPPLDVPFDPAAMRDIAGRYQKALRRRFDLALLPRPDDPWSGTLAAAASVPRRLGYDHPRTRTFLTGALPLPPPGHAANLATHLAEVAAGSLGASGAPILEDCHAPHITVTEADLSEADTVLAGLAPVVGAGPLVLHPGSGWRLKNWPATRWAELAVMFRRRHGLTPLVVGGPGEQKLVEAVVKDAGGCACPLSAGALSLGGLAALQRQARLVIATDSGPLHLAAMVGAPVIGIYGPADPLTFGPLCPPERRRIVRIQLPCSPCNNLLDPPCGASREPACIMGVTVEAVLAAAEDRMACSDGRNG